MNPSPRTVATIGNFDGVHIGHAALVQTARQLADTKDAPGTVLAVTFDPHPLTRLRPEHAPPRLSTFADKADQLRALGVDRVIHLEPSAELLALAPETFIEQLVREHAIDAFVEGSDFHFGKARAGTIDTLRQLGDRLGFDVEVVPPVPCGLTDQTVVRASSSAARWQLQHGRVRDATLLLGRPYTLTGEVTRGDRRGRAIGFPTANLKHHTLAPQDGVYAAIATLPSGDQRPAAVNIGTRPTVDGMRHQLEAHILGLKDNPNDTSDWSPIDGLPEYGWTCRLSFIAFLRDQVRFNSIDELRHQLERDCARALDLVDPILATTSPSTGPSHAKEGTE